MAGRNVNTSNRQTMGTSAAAVSAQQPLRGRVVQTRPGKRTQEQRKANRRQVAERLGPGYVIRPSLKIPDASGLSASTLANGKIIPSALGNRDQFYGPPPEGRASGISATPWRPPNRGKTS